MISQKTQCRRAKNEQILKEASDSSVMWATGQSLSFSAPWFPGPSFRTVVSRGVQTAQDIKKATALLGPSTSSQGRDLPKTNNGPEKKSANYSYACLVEYFWGWSSPGQTPFLLILGLWLTFCLRTPKRCGKEHWLLAVAGLPGVFWL